MITLLLSDYEKDALYLGEEGSRGDLDRHGSLLVWGDAVWPVRHEVNKGALDRRRKRTA